MDRVTDNIAEKVGILAEWMINHDQKLALAESCTGGLLASWITDRPGASQYFEGSVVSYSAAVKNELLDVPWSALQAYGEVSLPVARSMARGARDHFNTHWVVSITGIAGPDGGSPDKPVGTVCFAISGPGIEEVRQKYFEEGSRQKIRQASALYALDFLNECLQS